MPCFGVLELVNGVDVFEHERKVENAELLGELLELRERRGRHLNIALQQRFENLVIVIKRGLRKDFHAGFAIHLVIDALLE